MSKIFKSLVASILIICLVHTRKQRGSGDCGDESRRLPTDKGPEMCDSQGREHWRQIKHWISSSPSSFGVLAAFSVITLLISSFLVYDVERSSTSPYCKGEGCRNLDPEGTNCKEPEGVQEVLSRNIKNDDLNVEGTLTMFRSTKCSSNWVRWERVDGSAKVEANPKIRPDGVPHEDAVDIADQFGEASAGEVTWSAMVTDRGDTCMAISFIDPSDGSVIDHVMDHDDNGNRKYEYCSVGNPGDGGGEN